MLKYFRNPIASIFLSLLLLFVSCNGPILLDEKNLTTEDISFNYSIFENNKGNLLDLSSFDDIIYSSSFSM